MLGWDRPAAGLGSRVRTLRERLPADLRSAPGPEFAALPFVPLYLLGDEFAAEIANRTVHAVMHVGWVPDGGAGYRGQLAVLVNPNGMLGAGYLAAIRPFRNLVVYPRMMRDMAKRWKASATGETHQIALPAAARALSTFTGSTTRTRFSSRPARAGTARLNSGPGPSWKMPRSGCGSGCCADGPCSA